MLKELKRHLTEALKIVDNLEVDEEDLSGVEEGEEEEEEEKAKKGKDKIKGKKGKAKAKETEEEESEEEESEEGEEEAEESEESEEEEESEEGEESEESEEGEEESEEESEESEESEEGEEEAEESEEESEEAEESEEEEEKIKAISPDNLSKGMKVKAVYKGKVVMGAVARGGKKLTLNFWGSGKKISGVFSKKELKKYKVQIVPTVEALSEGDKISLKFGKKILVGKVIGTTRRKVNLKFKEAKKYNGEYTNTQLGEHEAKF